MTGPTMRTTPRQARSKRSVDLILDAAERLFHERGVADASTIDIAEAAGISVGRLYYWFPDKDAVVAAVMCRAESRCRAFVDAAAADVPGIATEALVATQLPKFVQFFRENPGSLSVVLHYGSRPDSPGASLRQLWIDRCLQTLLARSSWAREHPSDALVVAHTCVGTAIGMISEAVRQDEADSDRIIRELGILLLLYTRGRLDDRWS
jgi:AcrR family transcriptional regulator